MTSKTVRRIIGSGVAALVALGVLTLSVASIRGQSQAPLAPIKVSGARWIELSPVVVAAESFYPQKLTVGNGGVTAITSKAADLATNAESLGAVVHRATDRPSLERALEAARGETRTSVVYVPVDADARVPGYGCWWDVPVSDVPEQASVKAARKEYEKGRRKARWFV